MEAQLYIGMFGRKKQGGVRPETTYQYIQIAMGFALAEISTYLAHANWRNSTSYFVWAAYNPVGRRFL